MAGDDVAIAAVGGLRTAEGVNVLGTDPLRIADAVRRLWSPAGVLLLVDMGSAVLSAEEGLAMLPPGQQLCCRISNAPLVEGAIVAAVEAGLGHTLERVNSAAEAASTLRKV
jgi:dihydroxyacetone kinase DhaKLM complex PTS-EIIA-like component DhaM